MIYFNFKQFSTDNNKNEELAQPSYESQNSESKIENNLTDEDILKSANENASVFNTSDINFYDELRDDN